MHTPSVWVVTCPDASRPTTRRIAPPLTWDRPIRTMLRDAYWQAFASIDANQLRALEVKARAEGKAAAELDCQTAKGVPMRITLELRCPDRFPDAPTEDDTHQPKFWRLSFDGTSPPRVAYVRSAHHMGDEIRATAFHVHGLTVAETFGPRFADMLRRATAEHTTRTTYRCEGTDGRTVEIPITLTDENTTPIDVADLL